MTKLQLLHRALNEHLMASLDQIMVLVSGTVLEYEEETIRVRKENEVLRRRLTVSTHQEPRADLPEQFHFEFGPEAPMPEQESSSDLLCIRHVTSLSTMTEMNHDITSTFTQNYGPSDSSYMAPLEFEPTEPQLNTSRRQRFSFACPVCAKVYARECTLNIHMRIHSKTRPYSVRKHKTFFYGEQKRKLKQNQSSQDQENRVCGPSEVSRKSRRLDSTSPVESPAPSQDVPNVPIVSRTSKVHKTKRKGKNRLQLFCPVCNQEYYRLCHLSRHMTSHKTEARNRLLNIENPREETCNRDSEELEQTRNVTSADPETLTTSSREIIEDSTALITNETFPEIHKSDCFTDNLKEEDVDLLEIANPFICDNPPTDTYARISEKSEQNKNVTSADPKILTASNNDVNTVSTMETEQTTNETYHENHKSDCFSHNLKEEDLDLLNPPEETCNRKSEQNRNITSEDLEILAASSQEINEDSASDTEQMTDQIYPENDCLTHNLREKETGLLKMANYFLNWKPAETFSRESEGSLQNWSVISKDPEILAASSRELNEDFTSDTEPMTDQICHENHEHSYELENHFTNNPPAETCNRNVILADPDFFTASSREVNKGSTANIEQKHQSVRLTHNLRENDTSVSINIQTGICGIKESSCDAEKSSSSDEEDTNESSLPDPSAVTVMRLKKKMDGGRLYNKRFYCLFCFKPISKIARHLESNHKDEPEVAQAIAFPKGSKERKTLLTVLRNKGNQCHNAQVLKDGKGIVIPRMQSSSSGNVSDYMHCINCAAYLKTKSLWRHMQNCPLNEKLKEAKRLMPKRKRVGKEKFWVMMLEMNDDAITRVVREEKIILKLGQDLFKELGHDATNYKYIRQKMRETGRLVLQTKKQGKMKEVSDFFIPANLPHVVEAINIVAGYDEVTNTYRRPSLAVKLGQNLMKLGNIVESEAIVSDDINVLINVEAFKKIYTTNWSEYVSSQTIKKLSEADLGSTQLQVIAEDVERMHKHLESRSKEFQTKLEEEPSGHHWEELAKVTLCQVIVLNLRREGEVSKMPLNSFVLRESSSTHPELVLTDLEKLLCKIFHSIEIPGKHGMNVLIFLTHDMVASMELLVKTRRECDALDENVFMFGIPQSLSHYKESEVVLQTARSCGSKHPEALYSPRLIKHVATMFTAINMKDKDMNDLLVHDVMSHQQDSMLPEGPLRLVKMCEMLMALEHEELSDFKERNADEIQINSQGETERILIDSNRSDSENETEMTGNEASLSSSAVPGDEKNTSLLPFQINEPDTALSYDASTSATAMSEEINEELIKTNDLKESHSRKRASQIQRTRWSAEEVLAVEATLMDHIISGTVPRKAQCVKCIKRSPAALQHRSWLAVKFYVKNRIDSLKKKL